MKSIKGSSAQKWAAPRQKYTYVLAGRQHYAWPHTAVAIYFARFTTHVNTPTASHFTEILDMPYLIYFDTWEIEWWSI